MSTLSSKTITYEQLAKVIDHSLLKPELTEADVIAGCELADRYHTATVCVKPCHVKLAAEVLKDSDVLVSTVVGFPHGSNLTEVKVLEAEKAMDDAYKQVCDKNPRNVLLKFDGKSRINSAGIAIVINLVMQRQGKDCKIFITGVSKHFRKIFELVGLTKYTTIVDSEEEIERL